MTLLFSIILGAWVLALVQTIVNLAVVPRLTTRSPQRFPRVSVVIPARDEERTIGRTVRAMLAQTYPELEIIVVNDRSTDATGAILESLADPRLIVIHGEEPSPGWLGKPWALHQGSGRATGELLLFVDADVIYEPDAMRAVMAYMEAHPAALLSLFPRMVMHGFWEHVIMPNLAFFLLTFMPVWAVNRVQFRLFAVGGGPGNLAVRADYEAVGGHAALKDAVVDDVALARLMRRSGRRTEVVRADEYVSVRMYEGLREIIDGFTKNAFAVFGYNYGFAIAAFVLAPLFHFVPFAVALTGNALAIAVVVTITLTRLVIFLPLRYRPLNALLGHPLMIAAWLWILLRSVWLTGIRRRLLWRGRTYDAGRTRFGAD
jgi:glycosyltransferase involved in cell wall biosynthesis